LAYTLCKSLLAVAIYACSSYASASQVYQLNLSIGTGSAVGTITTDGNTGVLQTSDIVDWNITLDGNPGNVLTLFDPLSGNNCPFAGRHRPDRIC
jgi:hypothetical protein